MDARQATDVPRLPATQTSTWDLLVREDVTVVCFAAVGAVLQQRVRGASAWRAAVDPTVAVSEAGGGESSVESSLPSLAGRCLRMHAVFLWAEG